VLELTALPSIDEEHWVPLVQETDALLVNGGDPLYLCHWMRQSGLADLLPSLRNTVYVGLSAGSIVMAPNIGEDFVRWTPPTGGDETLGIVDFSMFPHLDHEDLPDNSMADAEKWAAGMPVPAYAIDDQTAIKVTDGTVEVVSGGTGNCSPPRTENPADRRWAFSDARLSVGSATPTSAAAQRRSAAPVFANVPRGDAAPNDDDPLRAGDCPGQAARCHSRP